MLPTLVLKNQFGEQSNNTIVGGSVDVWCKFKVDSTNANGLGISGLSGNGVSAVYGYTQETPAGANPITQQGIYLFEFSSAFASILSANFGLRSPLSGSNINVTSGLTAGDVYVITSVGTSTAANWQTLGLPVGITPAVGAVFIAITSSAGTGTGVVQTLAAAGSGCSHMEVVGDPNETCNPSSGGGYIAAASFNFGLTMASYTPAGTNNGASPPIFTGTAHTLTGTVANSVAALADGTFVFAQFSYLSNPGPRI